MSFNNTTTDIIDEEFGFRCRRIITRPPPTSSLTPNNNIDFIDQENIIQPIDYYETGLKHDNTTNSKGKGISQNDRRPLYNSSYSSQLALSPVSPFTPQNHEQPLPSSFVSVNTLSPELTATHITPFYDENEFNDYHEEPKDTKTPEQVTPSQFLSLIKSDLPKTERIRQLFLMTLNYELDQQFPETNTTKDMDETEKKSRKKIRMIGIKAMEKISNREIDLFDNQHSGEVDTKFIYAEPSPKNERNRNNIRLYKKLCIELEKEMDQRKQAISDVYSYHARSQDEYQTVEKNQMEHGSIEKYIDLMDPDQQSFIQSFRAETNTNEDDIDLDSTSSTSPPLSLQENLTNISRNITELRHQLNYVNEHQKEAGKQAERLMKDISDKLRRDTLCFPTLTKKIDTSDHQRSQANQPQSLLDNPDLQNSTELNYMEQRMKKRRILGLTEDTEMEAKATFEFLQLLSKLH